MEEKAKKVQRSPLGRGLAALISQPAVPITPKKEIEGNVVIQNNVLETKADNNTVTNLNTQSGDRQPKLAKIVSIPQISVQEMNSTVRYVDINNLINNPKQPRVKFKEAEIIELAASLKQLGVLQPIVVRNSKDQPGKLEIVAGERRWRASKLAGLEQVPVTIKDLTDLETLEISIVENVQRENLNPIEQAVAYQRLIDEFNLSHEEVADRIGKDRTTVSNIVRILKLSKDVQSLIAEGKFSLGHAKALLGIKDQNAQISLARKVINENLSVRALENLISRVAILDVGAVKRPKSKSSSSQDAANDLLIDRLRRTLGTKVQIKQSAAGKGAIQIEFFSADELGRIVDTICPFSEEKVSY
jgi:ParB family chromosome partitioning protein